MYPLGYNTTKQDVITMNTNTQKIETEPRPHCPVCGLKGETVYKISRIDFLMRRASGVLAHV